MQLGYLNSRVKYVSLSTQQEAFHTYTETTKQSVDRYLTDNELDEFDFEKSSDQDIRLIVPNVMLLGRRYEDILKRVQFYMSLNITLYFIKEDLLLEPNELSSFSQAIDKCFDIYKSLLSIRNSGIIKDIKDSGRRFGRKTGAKNKTYKLDARKSEIKAALKKGMSRHALARRLNVTAGCLNSYLLQRKLIKKEK